MAAVDIFSLPRPLAGNEHDKVRSEIPTTVRTRVPAYLVATQHCAYISAIDMAEMQVACALNFGGRRFDALLRR
jgi:hypothetical protein